MPQIDGDGRYRYTHAELQVLLQDACEDITPSLEERSMQSPPPCYGPEPCQHTDSEHAAFDAGLVAGDYGHDAETCPLDDDELREAWLCGHSVTYCVQNPSQAPRGSTNGGQNVL